MPEKNLKPINVPQSMAPDPGILERKGGERKGGVGRVEMSEYSFQAQLSEKANGASKGKRTRAAIQVAMCTCLNDRPLSEVTIAEICASARLSNGTFYIYFRSRMELAEEVLLQFSDFTQKTMRGASRRDPDNPARAATAAYVHLFQQNLGLMRCMLRHLDAFPEASVVFQSMNREWAETVVAAKTKRLREAGAPVDHDEFMRRAYALGGMTDHYLAGLLLDKDPNMLPFSQDLDAVIDTLNLLWERGMQP